MRMSLNYWRQRLYVVGHLASEPKASRQSQLTLIEGGYYAILINSAAFSTNSRPMSLVIATMRRNLALEWNPNRPLNTMRLFMRTPPAGHTPT